MGVTRYEWAQTDRLPDGRRAVALGVFDGLHSGHRAVLAAACGAVEPDGAILTATVLSMTGVPKAEAARLLTPEREEYLLDTLGMEEWIDMPFAAVCELSPEAFVEEILCQRLHAGLVCCGYNYRFGKGGVGTVETLQALCASHGIRVTVVGAVERDGEPISSTRVRQAVAAGDMAAAMRLLGRPFAVELPVTNGDHRGRRWGMPTLNQVFPDNSAVPRYGVYASLVTVGGREYRAVTNVGVHPTVGGVNRPQAETWIQDFDGELYGQTVSVLLIRFLREEQQFPSVEALRAQIAADAAQATAVLGGADGAKAVIFDFDDTLQDRVAAFLDVARWLLRRHMTGVTDDERERYAHRLLQENCGGYVDYTVFFHNLAAQWPFDDGVTGERLLWEYRRLFPLCSKLFPETVEVLQTLSRRGYRIGVITNGSALMQNRKLDVTALRPYLELVQVSEDEGLAKPNPELFRRAAERLCVAPENCVFVGDHPVNDVQGAIAAGMQAIYLNSRGLDDHPDGVPEVARLKDILSML